MVETICDIIDEVPDAQRSDATRERIVMVPDRPGHDRRYAIDFSKLQGDLGWIPAESFETGIRKTVSWYRRHMKWVNRVRTGEYRSWIKRHYG